MPQRVGTLQIHMQTCKVPGNVAITNPNLLLCNGIFSSVVCGVSSELYPLG